MPTTSQPLTSEARLVDTKNLRKKLTVFSMNYEIENVYTWCKIVTQTISEISCFLQTDVAFRTGLPQPHIPTPPHHN